MDRAETLFCRRWEQITERSKSRDLIDLADLSLGLYQLLLDERPLLPQVKLKNEKVRFEVFSTNWADDILSLDPKPTWFAIHDIDASSGSGNTSEVLSLNCEQFIALPVFWFEGRPLSVRHVIKYGRNIEGGGHFTSDTHIQAEEDEILRGYGLLGDDFVRHLGLDSQALHLLTSIGQVASRAMKPVYDRLQGL